MTYILPRKSAKRIREILSSKKLEELNVIDEIEANLKNRRGYVFHMPKKGSPVILLLSGGLDSVLICDILLRQYELEVYPIFLRRGQLRMGIEEKSVNFFTRYFKRKYPEKFHQPLKENAFIPPFKIRKTITDLGEKKVNEYSPQWLGIPVYTLSLVSIAVQYGYYLEIVKKIKSRTIFCGFMNTDGNRMKYETLTATRVAMQTICNLTDDWTWQFTSLALEKELNYFFGKKVLLTWADHYNVPVHKTFSCIDYSYFHCGECTFCLFRKQNFNEAGIEDKTFYLNSKGNSILKRVLNKFYILLFIDRLLLFFYSLKNIFLVNKDINNYLLRVYWRFFIQKND